MGCCKVFGVTLHRLLERVVRSAERDNTSEKKEANEKGISL